MNCECSLFSYKILVLLNMGCFVILTNWSIRGAIKRVEVWKYERVVREAGGRTNNYQQCSTCTWCTSQGDDLWIRVENFMTLYGFKETRYECVLLNAVNQVFLIIHILWSNIIQTLHDIASCVWYSFIQSLYYIASSQISPLGFAKSMSVTMYKSYNSATYIEADIGTSLSTDDSNERGLYVAKIDTQTSNALPLNRFYTIWGQFD